MGRYAEGPVLRGFVQTSTRSFGLTPGSVVRAVAKGWTRSYRDFASVSGELEGKHHGVVRFKDVHPTVYVHSPYAICFRALILGACDLVGGAEVQMKLDDDARQWDLHVRW